MKPIILNLVKAEDDIFCELFPIDEVEIGNLDEVTFADIWEALGLSVSRPYMEVEIVISVRNPKPRIIDISDLPDEEVKYWHYKKLDEFYNQGELILKEKQIRNGVTKILVKCPSYGILTDPESLKRYFLCKLTQIELKGKLSPVLTNTQEVKETNAMS